LFDPLDKLKYILAFLILLYPKEVTDETVDIKDKKQEVVKGQKI